MRMDNFGCIGGSPRVRGVGGVQISARLVRALIEGLSQQIANARDEHAYRNRTPFRVAHAQSFAPSSGRANAE